MFSSSSSSVSPWLNTPGISLSLPTYQPSSTQYSSVKYLTILGLHQRVRRLGLRYISRYSRPNVRRNRTVKSSFFGGPVHTLVMSTCRVPESAEGNFQNHLHRQS